MDSHEFIFRIREIVRDAAISDTLTVINKPPGRKPSPDLIEATNWYRTLDADQRRNLAGVIALAIDYAVFGFFASSMGFALLKTIMSIITTSSYAMSGGTQRLLNSQDNEMLHDIYNER
jgi:hypothetical protein